VTARLEHFAEIVSRDQFNLAEASLMLAQDIYPDLDIPSTSPSSTVSRSPSRSASQATPFSEQRVLALNYYLFNEMRFSGNLVDYYDPRNSYLNEVMERRTGFPSPCPFSIWKSAKRLGST